MAFAYSKLGETVTGNQRKTWGSFTNGGSDTGGDIVTGLSNCYELIPYHTGSAVVDSAPVVNETLSADGFGTGTITIVTTAGADGGWTAYGI